MPALPPLAGVRLGATAAGIRYQGRTDLVMIELARGTTAAGVFTITVQAMDARLQTGTRTLILQVN